MELRNTKIEAETEAELRNQRETDPKIWYAAKQESGHWAVVWKWARNY